VKKTVVACFNVIYQHLPGAPEKIHVEHPPRNLNPETPEHEDVTTEP